MKLESLENAVTGHAGEFLCEQIDNASATKVVRFTHVVTPASAASGIPEIGRLRDFHDTFGSVLFYHDANSEDAAKYIAPPSEWPELRQAFSQWVDGLDDDEPDQCVPDWVCSCLVVGETPYSGNYILMATGGEVAGQVFEFDHDGMEFTHRADDLVQFVELLLKPDDAMLTEFASHMRFADGDGTAQWWIRELRDNRGHVAKTAP